MLLKNSSIKVLAGQLLVGKENIVEEQATEEMLATTLSVFLIGNVVYMSEASTHTVNIRR